MSNIKFITEADINKALDTELADLQQYIKGSAHYASRIIRKYALRSIIGNPEATTTNEIGELYGSDVMELRDLEHIAYLIDRVSDLTNKMELIK